MGEGAFRGVDLVCPRCRHARDGALHVQRLEAASGGLRCAACAAEYPVVRGVPIVLRDVDAWLQNQGIFLGSFGPALRRRIPALAQEDALLRAQRGATGALKDKLRGLVVEGRWLDLGCGAGVGDAIGLDLRFTMARAAGGLVADAADPPFLPASFDGVFCLNLLDSCADPALVLAQSDACLRPGGELIIACAFAFRDEITPVGARFGPTDLEAALLGRPSRLGWRLDYELLELRDGLSWELRLPRARHAYEVLWIRARKR